MSAKTNKRMLARALGAVLVAVFAVLAAGCTLAFPINPSLNPSVQVPPPPAGE